MLSLGIWKEGCVQVQGMEEFVSGQPRWNVPSWLKRLTDLFSFPVESTWTKPWLTIPTFLCGAAEFRTQVDNHMFLHVLFLSSFFTPRALEMFYGGWKHQVMVVDQCNRHSVATAQRMSSCGWDSRTSPASSTPKAWLLITGILTEVWRYMLLGL